MSTRGEQDGKRRGTLYVLEDDPPATRPRWYCHWDGGSAPGFENLEDAVSWGLTRARTVVVRTLGTVFYWAGDRPSDWEDDDLEGPLRAWPPSATERRAIDAAYEAAVAADRADSEARAAYEDARLSWLRERVPELAGREPAHQCQAKDGRSNSKNSISLAPSAVPGAREPEHTASAPRIRLWPRPALTRRTIAGSLPSVPPWRASAAGRVWGGARCWL